MVKNSYKQCQSIYILFVKRHGNRLAALTVLVDNIVATNNDDIEVRRLKSRFAYEIEDLG